MTSRRVCSFADIPQGGVIPVEVDDYVLALVRVGDEVFAIEDECSHASFPLSDGDVEGCTVECALHGSRFDLRTGESLGPPATMPVPVFAVSVVDGEVYVEL